jgi:hypothetical protein
MSRGTSQGMSREPVQEAQVTGGCLCGALRYGIAAGGELCVYCCHCLDCQRLSSSAFAVSMLLPVAAFALLQGEPAQVIRRAESRRQIHGFFCAGCGTRLYDRFPAFPAIMVLKAGTLDDTRGLEPVAQFWTSRKQDWVVLPADQIQDARQPDGFDAVIARYRARRGGRNPGS